MGVNVRGLVQRFDVYQREHPRLAFPIAVFKKFGDDRGGYLAALISYYGFFSIFPLLLAFVTVLGFVLGDNPELQQKIVSSALAQFPVIGDQIRRNVHSIRGSGIALVVGVGLALWAGMGVVQALQNAMNAAWNVPVREKPNFVKARLKALAMLAVLGAAVVVAAGLSGIAAGGGSISPVLKLVALAGSVAVNVGVFMVAFRVLTSQPVSWRDVAPGALVAGVAWGALQALGNYYVSNQLRNASQTYGAFALVIGLLSWLYLGAQLTILAAEVNVVRARKLWPRSLQPPLGGTEKRALRQLAEQEQRRPEEHIEVTFQPPEAASSEPGEHAGRPEHEGRPAEPAAPAEGFVPAGESAAAGTPGRPAFSTQLPTQEGDPSARTTGPGARPGSERTEGSTSPFSELPAMLQEIARHAQTLLRQELQLAKIEIAAKLRSAGIGAGLFGAAAVLGVLAALALLAAVVLGLATVLPAWAAGLVGALLVAAVAGILAARGKSVARRASPLAPQQAIGMLTSTRDLVTQAWEAGSRAAAAQMPASGPQSAFPGSSPRGIGPGTTSPAEPVDRGHDRKPVAGPPQAGTFTDGDAGSIDGQAEEPEPAPTPPPVRPARKLPEFPRF